MGKRLFYNDFNPKGINISGKIWTPTMIMYYRGLSKYQYNKLLERFSQTDILLNPSICANYTRCRQYTDNSETFSIGGRTWSLANVYFFTMSKQYEHDRMSYRAFANRYRYYKKSIGRRAVSVQSFLESMNYGGIFPRMSDLNSDSYQTVLLETESFVSKSRPKKVFTTADNVNAEWYECARQDPDMYWYLFKLHDEAYKALDDKHKEALRTIDTLSESLLAEKATRDTLQRQVIDLSSKLRSLEATKQSSEEFNAHIRDTTNE